MSFWKSLFGGGKQAEGGNKPAAALAEEEYKGYRIRAVMMRAGSEYQLAGTIDKDVGGEAKSHRFVRADRLPSQDEAASAALAKGRQLVDEQGDRLFL